LFVTEHELKSLLLKLKKFRESDFEDLEVKVEKICCELCEEKFFIPANLDLHMKIKHQSATENSENQQIKCFFCSKLLKNKNSYKYHLKLYHKEEAIRCKFKNCFAVFRSEKCLEEHYLKVHCFIEGQTNRQSALGNQPIKCLFCSKLFKSNKNYSAHLSLLHKDEAIRCKYRQCFAIFRTEQSLEEHLKIKHCLMEGKKPIECKVCKIWFSLKCTLRCHMQRKHASQVKIVKLLQCLFCARRFDSKAKLHNHIMENHKESIKCQLLSCHFYFTSKVEMENHFKNTHAIKCKVCHSSFSNNTVYLQHLKQKHIEKKCKFSRCAFYTDSKVELEKHVREKHSQKSENHLECVYCGKYFAANRLSMLRHIRTFHSQIAIRCDKRGCGIFFKSQEELEKHKQEAHKKDEKIKKTVECFYCKKIIWDKQCYALHIKYHHSKEAIRCKYKHCFTFFKNEDDRQNHLEAKHPEKFCCALCDYKYSRKHNLRHHFRRHHLPKDKKCPHCPKLFGSQQVLKQHVDNNHKPQENCPHCKKVGTNLNRHVVTTNCPTCSQPFPCKKLFADHKLKCKKVHKCLDCGQIFTRAFDLKHHINLRHKLGQKWRGYKCSFCKNGFPDLKSLKNHQLSEHFALMKYRCKFCEEAFNFRETMRYHIFLKHKIGGFKCEMCDKKYCTKRVLSVHLQNIHLLKKQMVECADCGKTMKKISFKKHFINKHLK